MSSVTPTLRAWQHGAQRQTDGTVEWSVWAPGRSRVHLSIWNDQAPTAIDMQLGGDGYFFYRKAQAVEGLRYAFCLDDDSTPLPDPASRWQPDGVHRASALFFPESFSWHDGDWQGLAPDGLAIYELHIGTFTKAGTFAAAVARLPELADLGVTAIELMPVAQFPGTRNWGYDGVHPYAVQNSYGGPRGLQHFVDEAHAAGLGVILDVVYNHLGPEGNYFGKFGPYFTDRYHTPWGQALNYDGPSSDPVRRFVIDNACMWVRDFHIDGLRLDAVQAICDFSAWHLLAELNDAVKRVAAECGRKVVVIAETDQNDARQVQPVDRGGYGLDGVWADDFHHAIHSVLTRETDGYYEDFGEPQHIARAFSDMFVYGGCYSRHRRRRHGSRADNLPRDRFVWCLQNHDQIGNRAQGDRLGQLVPPDALRLAAALLLLGPATPLLFMGEEYGETRPFPFFCSFLDKSLNDAVRRGRLAEFAALEFSWDSTTIPDPAAEATFQAAQLSWDWPAGSTQAGLRLLYRDLLHARRHWAPLLDRTVARARIDDQCERLLIVERGRRQPLVVWANLSDSEIDAPPRTPRSRKVLLSTAAERYGGTRVDRHKPRVLLPYEAVVWGLEEWQEAPA